VFIESGLVLLQTGPWLLRGYQDGWFAQNFLAEKLYEKENFPELLIKIPRTRCLCPVSRNFFSVDHFTSEPLITHINLLTVLPLLVSCSEFAGTPMDVHLNGFIKAAA
jgi:hypothetical protein